MTSPGQPCRRSLGYLLLDAWLANQDRHQKTGLSSTTRVVSAWRSYDHAAALGQNETDEARRVSMVQENRYT
jgi:hypothetical protein